MSTEPEISSDSNSSSDGSSDVTANKRAFDLDDVFGLAAHQMKTPLAAIKGAVDLLVEDIETLSREQAELVRMVRRNANRSIRMVEHLLALSRTESGKIEIQVSDFTPLDVLRESLSSAQLTDLSGRGVDFEIVEGDANCDFRGDREKTVQLLGYLVENAARFATPRSKVTLTWECRAMEIRFSVSDEGPGIPAEEASMLFEPFYRKPRHGELQHIGDGLGLAVARALVGFLGGSLAYEANADGGSTFRVSLPALSAS